MKQTLTYSIIVAALAGLTLSLSCGDDTFKKARPAAAGISSDGKKESTEVIDTLKNYFKENFRNKSYSFTLIAKDEGENKAAYLIYSLIGGTGSLTADNQLVKDTVKVTAPDTPIRLVFTPSESTGEYVLSFTSYNQFGLSSSEKTTLRLRIIKNLPPVAKFKIIVVDPKIFLYRFDATASFDSDGKFGGDVALYEYTIYKNGEKLPPVQTYKKTRGDDFERDLPGAGSYTITLRTQDNEGMYSDPAIYSEPLDRPFIVK